MQDVTVTDRNNTTLLVSPYNRDMIGEAKRIGGRWNPTLRAWEFDIRDHDKVEQLAARFYGYTPADTGETVTIRVNAYDYVPDDYREYDKIPSPDASSPPDPAATPTCVSHATSSSTPERSPAAAAAATARASSATTATGPTPCSRSATCPPAHSPSSTGRTNPTSWSTAIPGGRSARNANGSPDALRRSTGCSPHNPSA